MHNLLIENNIVIFVLLSHNGYLISINYGKSVYVHLLLIWAWAQLQRRVIDLI